MKKILYIFVALLIAGCSEQDVYNDIVDAPSIMSEKSNTDQYSALLEQARWGNSDAYLKLAGFYHDGIGVKADFMGMMSMLAMADQYGASPKSTDSYLLSLPETDNTKLIIEAFASLDRKNTYKTDSLTEILIANGSAEGYALKGILQIERGDTLGGKQTIQTSADMGSSFARLLLCAVPTPGSKNNTLDMDMLKDLSVSTPLASKLLGDYYSGYEKGYTEDEHLAAYFYKKADEQGCLGKRPARYLINYYERNGISIEPKEMERLRILSGNTNPDVYIPDSIAVDIDYIDTDSVVISE
jgi:TPR repeat protein